MPKVPLTAIKDHVYAGRRVKAGADYEASGQSDARLMKALGRAKDREVIVAPAPVVSKPVQTYSTRMLTAAAPIAPRAAAPVTPPAPVAPTPTPAATPPASAATVSPTADEPSPPAAKKVAAKRAGYSSRRTDDEEG